MTQPPNLPEAVRKVFAKSKDRRKTVQYLTDEQLVIVARYWKYYITSIPDDNAPVYETTLVHAILPELIRRFDYTVSNNVVFRRDSVTNKIIIVSDDGSKIIPCSIELLQEFVNSHNQLIDATQPVPMLLHCPICTVKHVDDGKFATKPHHTHACQGCGHVWRPAIVNTVGVEYLPGYKNTYPTPTEAVNNAMGMDADEAYQYLKAWQHGDDLSRFDTPVSEN